MEKQKFRQFEAFQDGTAEQYKELLSLYLGNKMTPEEIEFTSLNCERMKGIFFSKKFNDLRVGKFDLQVPISFKEFKSKIKNTFGK